MVLSRVTFTVTLVALLAASAPSSAAPQQPWVVLPFDVRGVSPIAADTFRDLLQAELAAREGMPFLSPGGATCVDAGCALAAGNSAGAGVAVYGSLSALGAKTVAVVTVLSVPEGEVLSSQRMAVDRVEDLDAVASRMAEAIVTGKTTDDTARLGSITAAEVPTERRRKGDSGFSLRFNGVVPLGSGYSEAGFGVGFDATYWFETPHFAIEPRIGVRFDTFMEEDRHYVEVPVDVGAFYILSLGDFSPFFGGGGGLRYFHVEEPDRVVVGSVLSATSDRTREDDVFGFGMYVRAGLLILRTYEVRMAINLDYNITFATVNRYEFPQSLTFGVSVIF